MGSRCRSPYGRPPGARVPSCARDAPGNRAREPTSHTRAFRGATGRDDEALRRRGAMLQAAESFEWAFELYSQSNDYDGMVRTAIALGDPGRAERALTPLTSGSDAARAQAALGLLYRNAGPSTTLSSRCRSPYSSSLITATRCCSPPKSRELVRSPRSWRRLPGRY